MPPSNNRLDIFEPIQVPEIPEPDYGVFASLNDILKKVGRVGQRTTQTIDLLRSDVNEAVEQLKDDVEQNRLRQNELESSLKSLETGLLDFMDIIDNLHGAVEKIDDPAFVNAVEVAVRAKDQINQRIGIQQVPGVGSRFDNQVHFIANSKPVQNEHQDGFILEIIENGYVRGPRLLRKATVVCGKWSGGENK